MDLPYCSKCGRGLMPRLSKIGRTELVCDLCERAGKAPLAKWVASPGVADLPALERAGAE